MSQQLSKALVDSLKDPAVRKTLETTGFEVVASSPAEFADALAKSGAQPVAGDGKAAGILTPDCVVWFITPVTYRVHSGRDAVP